MCSFVMSGSDDEAVESGIFREANSSPPAQQPRAPLTVGGQYQISENSSIAVPRQTVMN
ncbi:MAG: hypothetical protein JWN70_4486 [Planctomycetaceae bacterium]|nr:hypothetical protein [Planctomycetaceae bacterium]